MELKTYVFYIFLKLKLKIHLIKYMKLMVLKMSAKLR